PLSLVYPLLAIPHSEFPTPHFSFPHLHLLLPRRMRRVDDVEQQVRRPRLLERRAERGDEVMRQLANEAHGVRETKPVPAADVHLAGQGVERREQPVFHEDVVARQGPQNARLAGVGVTDERGAGARPPALTLIRAMVRYILEPLLEHRDLAADGSAIRLELGLAGTPQPDTASDARQVGPHPREGGQQILEIARPNLNTRL